MEIGKPDAYDFTGWIRESTNAEVNEIVAAFFVGLRMGLAETGRMEYNESDRVYTLINEAEAKARQASRILIETRDDPVHRQRTVDRASR